MKREQPRNILDYVFRAPEPEVRTFSETMRTPVNQPSKELSGLADAKSGKMGKVKAAVFLKQQSGHTYIEHGWDGDDYCWHIEPTERHNWAVSMDRVITASARTMSAVIPQRVKVDIFMPAPDWDIKCVTFKAHQLKACWNVTDQDLTRLTMDLFRVLNPLVK